MSTEHRIDQWLRFQRRMVGPEGSTATRIELQGPDDDTIGTWALEGTEEADSNLGEQIRAVLTAHADELPRGQHRCRLLAFDQQSRQVSFLPYTLQGRSSAALAAGHEEKARQQARAIEVQNWEAQSLSLRNALQAADQRNEKLEAAILASMDRQSQLLDAVLTMQASRLDDETRMAESAAKQEAWRELALTVKPLFEALMPLIAVKAGAALGFGLDGKPLLPGAETQPATPGGQNAERTEVPANGQPANGAPSDGDSQPESTPTDGEASASRDGRKPAGGGRRKTPARQQKRAARNP